MSVELTAIWAMVWFEYHELFKNWIRSSVSVEYNTVPFDLDALTSARVRFNCRVVTVPLEHDMVPFEHVIVGLRFCPKLAAVSEAIKLNIIKTRASEIDMGIRVTSHTRCVFFWHDRT